METKNNNTKFLIFDIEANNLLPEVSKIHCLSYSYLDEDSVHTITSSSEIKEFLLNLDNNIYLVGHNIESYDIPVLKKLIFNSYATQESFFPVQKRIDTLGLSWYLLPEEKTHSLENYGNLFKIPKVKIKDWNNQTLEDYINRCERDVKINKSLFKHQLIHLKEIYEDKSIFPIMNYLTFKLNCMAEQEEFPLHINLNLVESSYKELSRLKKEKISILSDVMPCNITYKEHKKPATLYKKDGTLSVRGEKWLKLLEEHNLPEDYSEPILVQDSEEKGNPQSVIQLKKWLFSLGWIPETYTTRINKDGEENEVPQIYDDNKEVCASIKKLYPIEPALKELDMLTIIKHRLGIFKAFKKEAKDSHVIASFSGLSTTLRIRHKLPITNLPKIYLFYGKEIRGSINTPEEDYLICGSDMTSLEDTTKQHFMMFFDPKYVREMRVPGFDPHIDIGVLSGVISKEEAEFYKNFKERKKDPSNTFTQEEIDREFEISQKRGISKQINFSAVYGAGPPKISNSTGMPLEQAKALHKTYWDRNKSVKQIAQACLVKEVHTQKWLYNPVSKFWYSLRHLKDRFSTINQGSGVFCFDTYLYNIRKRGIKISLQYHDKKFCCE